MFTATKRALVWCLALLMLLSLLPAESFAAKEELTIVQSALDFTKMGRIGEGRNEKKDKENKDKVRDTLMAAGAVACENLYLAGNFETIVNPGGYKKQGYFVQKITAADGEDLVNAYLELGYWICDVNKAMADAEQGYIEVYTSADNENYELVWECREGNGPAFENSRRVASLELPVTEGQKEIYVKVVMEHWNTYEGAGVAYSTLTGNVLELPVESDKKPHECAMVTTSANFNNLNPGEVTAEDIGAVAEENMFFGIDEVPLLSSRNGYEMASATWMVQAAEGEPLHDAVLTIVGRTFWGTVEEQKANHYLKVYASVDGVNFKPVREFRGTESEDDTQRFVVDLTSVVQGYSKCFVKLEWMVFDSPHIFGIRSVSLVGNTEGIDPNGGGNNRVVVSAIQSFTGLPVGKVDKDAIESFKSANLTFGYEKTPLLTAKKAGMDAYATWKLNAVEGEPFVDCHLTMIGRFGYVDPALKDTASIRVYLSVDGETYSEVKEILPTEDQSDTQKIVVDLSDQTYGLSEFYVKIYWSSKDDPSAMGLRCMALVANAGADYDLFTPELEDRVITDAEMPTEPSQPAEPTQPTQPTEPQQPQTPENGQLWIVVAVAAAVVVAAVVVIIVIRGRKKKA